MPRTTERRRALVPLCVQSQPFSASGVAAACRAGGSVKSFQRAISSITLRNVRVDLLEALNASFHFDDETFVSGRDIITAGLQMVKANNRQQNFEAAQDSLGETLHTLQVFLPPPHCASL